MAKIKPIEALKTYGVSGSLLTIAGYMYVYSGYLPLPVVLGFGVPAGFTGLAGAARLYSMIAPEQKSRLYRGKREIPVNANGQNQGNLMMSTAQLIPFINASKPQQKRKVSRDEFIFFDRDMKSQIPESQLYAFCKASWRRQRRALISGTLQVNQVFSREYFTSRAAGQNYTPLADYESIMHVLGKSELMVNRWKGGRQLYPPHITVEIAKEKFS